MTIVATATWNCIDLVSTFLLHYRKLGVDRILAMDFDSTDGTRDVLTSSEWRNVVQLVPFPGIRALDSSNLLLAIAQRHYGNDAWCLFCDPDELLVTPSMTIRDAAATDAVSEAGAASIPRFNVTASLSVARDAQFRLSALDALTLRIDGRHERDVGADIRKEVLEPPWIFTAIPGKVFVRVGGTSSIGDGDHSAETASGRTAIAPDGVYLLHYPFRTYSQYLHKIELASIDFNANPGLPPGYGWQLRRWIGLADSGKLHEEYLQQFIPDERVEPLLQERTLTLDQSVVKFHRSNESTGRSS